MNRIRATAGAHSQGKSTHPMMLGVFMGVLLGLCLALGLALYLNRTAKPFTARNQATDTPSKPDTTPQKGIPKFEAGKPDRAASAPSAAPVAPGKPNESKARFDFYKILPGEEAVTGKELNQDKAQGSTARVVYYLQAGAFQKPSDADNLKARLALAGLEAQIQTATLPDASIWHRVRLGPFSNAQDLDEARAALKENKIGGTLIKVNESPARH